MAHNNNIGKITSTNVAPKGTGANLSTTTDSGSILGLRYIKDSTTGGSSGTGVAPTDLGSVAIKDWFETYVGDLGNYTNSSGGDTDIKWSDYRSATILGMKVQAKNETASRYKNSDNAQLKITPLNGSGTAGAYTITVGGSTVTSSGNRGTAYTSGDFTSGKTVAVELTDNDTGTSISMQWTTAYNDGTPTIRGSGTVAGPEYQFFLTGASGTAFGDSLYFFNGVQTNSRGYGVGYPGTG